MNRKRFWPTPTQALLLGVCLHREPAAAIQSWQDWKARVDLDDLDSASFEIMSLVSLRLLELGIADSDSGRIKGLRRYRWTRGVVSLRPKLELLKALQAAGIPTLVGGGSALAQTVYPDGAARGVHDTEILISASALDEAAKSANGELLKPWREEWWQAAVPFQCESTPTHILCPADQFLHACEQGMSIPGLQWLADCAFLLRHSPAPFDWTRLVEQARQLQLSLHARETLLYLREHFKSSIPGGVLLEMARVPVPLENRLEYFLAGRPEEKQHDFAHKVCVAACRYLRLKDGGRLRQFTRDFPRFLKYLKRPVAG